MTSNLYYKIQKIKFIQTNITVLTCTQINKINEK